MDLEDAIEAIGPELLKSFSEGNHSMRVSELAAILNLASELILEAAKTMEAGEDWLQGIWIEGDSIHFDFSHMREFHPDHSEE